MGAPKNSNPSNDQKNLTQPFSYDFEKNLSLIKEAFSYPTNQSLKIRDLTILSGAKKGVILFLEGTVDTKAIEETIIGPLIKITDIPEDGDIMSIIEETIVFTTGTKQVEKLQDAVKDLLGGNTLILFEGEHGVISAATTGFENRGVSEPTVENVVRGPKESFNESMAVNQSLIRKQINDNRLLCESISIGNKIVKEVSIIYLKGVVDEELLKDVKKRSMR